MTSDVFTSFTYNISNSFILQMYAGISPEMLQFRKTLNPCSNYVNYTINKMWIYFHIYSMPIGIKHTDLLWLSCCSAKENLDFSQAYHWSSCIKRSAMRKEKFQWYQENKAAKHLNNNHGIKKAESRRLNTHNSINLSKREMFDGIGPSSPLACISLHWNVFSHNY